MRLPVAASALGILALVAFARVHATLQEPTPKLGQISTEIRLDAGADGPLAINRQVIPLADLSAQLRAIYHGRSPRILHVDFGERVDPEVLLVLGRWAKDLKITLLLIPRTSADAISDELNP